MQEHAGEVGYAARQITKSKRASKEKEEETKKPVRRIQYGQIPSYRPKPVQ